MKKLHFVIAFLLFAASVFAQAPNGLNYQAIARNTQGVAITNQNISIRFTISDSIGTTVYYKETQSATTNQFGLFTLNIGHGAAVTGTFSSINWSSITPWLKVEMDPAGGNSYVNMGSSQLLSVPYAMYAASTPGPQIMSLNAAAGNIDGGATGYTFIGHIVNITLTSTTRITGSAVAILAMSLSGTQDFLYGLCYQNTSGPGAITNFSDPSDYTTGTATSTKSSWAASASVVLASGTYNIGFGVYNNGGNALDNNDWVNGWIMTGNQ